LPRGIEHTTSRISWTAALSAKELRRRLATLVRPAGSSVTVFRVDRGKRAPRWMCEVYPIAPGPHHARSRSPPKPKRYRLSVVRVRLFALCEFSTWRSRLAGPAVDTALVASMNPECWVSRPKCRRLRATGAPLGERSSLQYRPRGTRQTGLLSRQRSSRFESHQRSAWIRAP